MMYHSLAHLAGTQRDHLVTQRAEKTSEDLLRELTVLIEEEEEG